VAGGAARGAGTRRRPVRDQRSTDQEVTSWYMMAPGRRETAAMGGAMR
jgi:hypothetical protein